MHVCIYVCMYACMYVCKIIIIIISSRKEETRSHTHWPVPLRVVPSWMTNRLKLILVFTSSSIYQVPLIGNVEMCWIRKWILLLIGTLTFEWRHWHFLQIMYYLHSITLGFNLQYLVLDKYYLNVSDCLGYDFGYLRDT